MRNEKTLDELVAEAKMKRKMYAEGSLDDFSAKLGEIDNIDMNLDSGSESTSNKSKSSPTDDFKMPDLNISEDIGGLDEHKSADSTSMDLGDMAGLDDTVDLNLDELDSLADDNGDVSGAIDDSMYDLSDEDLDSMINGIDGGTGDEVAGEENGGDESTLNVSDEEDGADDSIDLEELSADGQPVNALDPKDEANRKKRYIGIMKRLYDTYNEKIKKFDNLNLPLDKERIFEPIFNDYRAVHTLLSEYVLGDMATDESLKIMKKITDFNIMYIILDDRIKTVTEYLKNPKK